MDNLLSRVDKALQVAGKTRQELADALGVSTARLASLRRRQGSSLSPERLLLTAEYLHCSLRWLVTGEGGEYVPSSETKVKLSYEARMCAQLINAMPVEYQAVLFAAVHRLSSGHLNPAKHIVFDTNAVYEISKAQENAAPAVADWLANGKKIKQGKAPA